MVCALDEGVSAAAVLKKLWHEVASEDIGRLNSMTNVCDTNLSQFEQALFVHKAANKDSVHVASRNCHARP